MTKDTGLLFLAAIARLHSGALDAQQLFNQFALADRVLSSDELMRAAKQLGFTVVTSLLARCLVQQRPPWKPSEQYIQIVPIRVEKLKFNASETVCKNN